MGSFRNSFQIGPIAGTCVRVVRNGFAPPGSTAALGSRIRRQTPSAALLPLQQFAALYQIQKVQLQFAQNGVRRDRRKQALALQYIVDMRLRNTCDTGNAAFRQFSALDTLQKRKNEPPVQSLEVYHRPFGLFPGEIG
jgi:hypothetical protein